MLAPISWNQKEGRSLDLSAIALPLIAFSSQDGSAIRMQIFATLGGVFVTYQLLRLPQIRLNKRVNFTIHHIVNRSGFGGGA